MENRWRVIVQAAIGVMILLTGCGGGSKNGTPPTTGDYVLLDLGRVATAGQTMAVNNHGVVVASRRLRSDPNVYLAHASRWTQGVWEDIHPPHLQGISYGRGITDGGQVLITVYTGKGITSRSFVLSNGVYTEITPPEGQIALPAGISEDGTVVGYCADSSSPEAVLQRDGFIWRNGTITMLPDLEAFGINRQGQFLLKKPLGDESATYFLRQPDGQTVSLTDLSTNATDFHPTAVSENGTIVGHIIDLATGRRIYYPAVLRNGTVEKLFEAEYGGIIATNAAGDVVVSYGAPVVYRPSGERLLLDSLLPRHPHGASFTDVNDRGELTIAINDGTYRDQGYKLMPRSLLPIAGQGTVTIKESTARALDGSNFAVRSVRGTLLTANHLEATLTARSINTEAREFTVRLSPPEAIEVGESYSITGPSAGKSPGGLTFFSSQTGIIDEVEFDARKGSVVVDAITDQAVTFRLVNIEMVAATPASPPYTFTLNATITVPR